VLNTNLTLAGTEVSQVRLDSAKKNLRGSEIELMLADINNMPYEANSFAQVTSFEVLEHVPDWQRSLNELVRIASDKVIVTVPYQERRVTLNCDNCGSTIYQSGHLHTFSQKDFLDVQYESNIESINFGKIYMDYEGLFNNIKRRISKTLSKTKGDRKLHSLTEIETENKFDEGHREYTCPSCYAQGKPTFATYVKRFGRMGLEVATFSPHWLLVEIKK
jgi:ubiquinone/menaquinone biosynthesis C-methylase UbiE